MDSPHGIGPQEAFEIAPTMDAQFLPKGSKSFAAFRFSASKKNAWLSFTTPQLRHFEVQHAAGAGARTAAAVHSWAWTSEQDMTGDQVEDELKMVQDLTKSTELCRMQRSCVPQEKSTSSNHLFMCVPFSYLFVPDSTVPEVTGPIPQESVCQVLARFRNSTMGLAHSAWRMALGKATHVGREITSTYKSPSSALVLLRVWGVKY